MTAEFAMAMDLAKDLTEGSAPHGLCCVLPIPVDPGLFLFGHVGPYSGDPAVWSLRLRRRLRNAGFTVCDIPALGGQSFVIVTMSPPGTASEEAYNLIVSIAHEVGFSPPRGFRG